MEKNSAKTQIRNQKVMVRLERVLELQRELIRAEQQLELSKKVQTSYDHAGNARVHTLKRVIEMLELPIAS